MRNCDQFHGLQLRFNHTGIIWDKSGWLGQTMHQIRLWPKLTKICPRNFFWLEPKLKLNRITTMIFDKAEQFSGERPYVSKIYTWIIIRSLNYVPPSLFVFHDTTIHPYNPLNQSNIFPITNPLSQSKIVLTFQVLTLSNKLLWQLIGHMYSFTYMFYIFETDGRRPFSRQQSLGYQKSLFNRELLNYWRARITSKIGDSWKRSYKDGLFKEMKSW